MSTSTALVGAQPIPLPSSVDELVPLTAALDASTHLDRMAWMKKLGHREMRAMWHLAEASQMKGEDLILGEGKVLIHEGKNSMWLFNRFQKRFAKVGDKVVGYNHNGAFVSWFSGPGHFTCSESTEKQGEIIIDYREIPKEQHPDFPPLRW